MFKIISFILCTIVLISSGEEHDTNYDHEAILGKNDAKLYEQFTPDESKKRLSILVDKMDKDSDGRVSREELKKWISSTSYLYVLEDRDQKWNQFKRANTNKLTWLEYIHKTYGPKKSNNDEVPSMQKYDRPRWIAADLDKDKSLNKDEFLDFINPEQTPHLRIIDVQERLAKIDKNHDGKIDMKEYVKDLLVLEPQGEEPDWLQSERENFQYNWDKNHDGFLDEKEIDNWIHPQHYDHLEAEVVHLFEKGDTDKDEYLTKKEFLDNHDLFVGSQATDFGEHLHRHTEL